MPSSIEPPIQPHKNRSTSVYWLPLIGYLLLSLLATWPLPLHAASHVPGIGDWGQNMWALWWTRQALLVSGQTPFYTNYLFYPAGVTLLFHPLDVSDGLLALPLYGLLGGPITYNLLIWLSFILGGYGSYLLALSLTGHRPASFVAGLIFALSPYHLLRIDLGHLNLSTIQWIPFYLLFVLRIIKVRSSRLSGLESGLSRDYEQPRGFWTNLQFDYLLQNSKLQLGYLASAVFFLVFMALNSWYYVLYCGLLTGLLLGWPAAGPWRPILTRRLVSLGIILSLALLILSPLWWPMIRLLGSTQLVGEHNPLRHSVDLMSLWLPGPPSTWAGWFRDGWLPYAAYDREPGASAYIGYTVLLLSLAGLAGRQWRGPAIWWAIVAGSFMLLALGPQLQIQGQVLDVTLPYAWLTNLPLFAIAGIPGRFLVITSLAWAMLAAYGLANGERWLTSKKRWPMICAVLIVLEYTVVPVRLSPTATADFYHHLATDRATYAILDIKWDANFLLHVQTVHGKPLIGGWLARLPADQAAYLEQDSLDKAFRYLLLGPAGVSLNEPADLSTALQTALDDHQVRYIVTHNDSARPLIESLLDWPVSYHHQEMVVYENLP